MELLRECLGVHLLGRDEAVLVAVKLLEDLPDLVLSGLHDDLLAEFAGLALISHLVELLLRLHPCFLFLLHDVLVPVVEFVGHLGTARRSVSQLEGRVDLRLEHFSAATGMNNALILQLFLLPLEIVVDLGLLREPHEDLALRAGIILRGTPLLALLVLIVFALCISIRKIGQTRVGQELLGRDTRDRRLVVPPQVA